MKNQLLFCFALAAFLIGSACSSPAKLIDSGEYDQALSLATRKIKGKSDIKEKYVTAIEEAFKKAQDRDMRDVNFLKKEGRPENWEKINRIYKGIEKRQARIEPFLPLYAETGYKAEFQFVKVQELAIESREKTASYLYDRAVSLIKRSEKTGDRPAAKEAFYDLRKIDDIYRDYKDKELLKEKARFLATEKWLVKMTNESEVYLPAVFERRLMKLDIGDLNEDWKQYFIRQEEGVKYDFVVNINLEDIFVSPQEEKERQFDESKEIEDGFEYVLDDNGNVRKDSSGNDIKIPKRVFIKATVLEIFQFKSVQVQGSWDLVDGWSGDLLKTEPLSVSTVFEHYASTLLGGDDRALTEETIKRLGSEPRPFPSDEAMLLDAADILKERAKDRVRTFN